LLSREDTIRAMAQKAARTACLGGTRIGASPFTGFPEEDDMQPSSLQPARTATIAAIAALGTILVLNVPWSRIASGGGTSGPAPVAVNCEPSQQAIVRQTMASGETQVNILCIGAGWQQPLAHQVAYPVAYADEYGRPVQGPPDRTMGPAPVPYAPQTAYAPQPIRYNPAPVSAPSQAQRPTTVTQRRVVSERPAVRGRSWQKSAMLIGGSTGAAAGIGGLIGGKKGALIGAALGGGGATIYEAAKR
jgi:hypothetical protein